jgi:hypothetical protein
MPPSEDDRNARQIEALRRYVAELGTDRERPAGGASLPSPEPERSARPPLVPWLLLTLVLVAASLIGGVLIGAARETGQRAKAAGPSGSAAAPTTTLTAPVASLECRTAVDLANRGLASAVRVQGVLQEYTQIMNDLRANRIDGRQAADRAMPSLVIGSIEAGKFDSALADYRKVVDQCRLMKP